jgi:hypothetical protein
MEKLEIGGNTFLRKVGTYLTKVGTKWVNKGNKLVATNPTCKLHSPYLLVINFTVNNTDKYTLTLQGDYKERYKEKGTEDNPITIDEMFILIRDKRSQWYKKD